MADLDLARRAVASPGWRWLRGMLTDTGIRVVGVGVHNGQPFILGHVVGNLALDRYYTDPPLFAPDLDDPATLGAVEHGLLAPAGVWVERVQTAALRVAYIARTADGAFAAGPVPLLEHYRDTLAAALVDGLEAVP